MDSAHHLIPIPDPGAVSRVLEGETVLVLPHRGRVNVLNELGEFIWQRVDGHNTLDDIVEAVCCEYAVPEAQAQQDVLDFLRLLAEKGALHLESR